MLPKQHRLTDNYDFQRVRRIGNKYNCSLFFATYAPAKNKQKDTRFGFVVSNKLDKRAPVRNRIKRLLREAVHNNLDKIKPGYDVTIVAKSSLKNADFKEVSNQVNKFLSKVSLT